MPVAFHTQLLPGQEYFWPGLRLHHSLAQLSFSNLRFPLALSNFAYAYKCQPGRGTEAEAETGAGTGTGALRKECADASTNIPNGCC